LQDNLDVRPFVATAEAGRPASSNRTPRIVLPIDAHFVVMTNSNMNALTELQAIAVEALAALDTGRQIQPFSSRTSSFNLNDAYRVTAAVRKIREAHRELQVGRKIGLLR
jgi:hypothetical protein